MSTPRFYSLITKDKDTGVFKQQTVRITFEIIEAVRDDGRYVVRGVVLATTGNRMYELGERVPVAWQSPDGIGEPVPVAVFGHNFRRAQGIIPAAAVAVGLLEIIQHSSIQPPPIEDPENPGELIDPPPVEAFVIFSGAGQFALQPDHKGLNPAPDPEDPEAPPEQTIKNLGAAWGQNGNHILLRFQIEGDEDDPLNEVPQLQVFKINRTLDSKTIPLKKDAEKKTVFLGANELGEGGIPVVDGELLEERVVEFDPEMLLKREEFPGSPADLVQQKLKVKDNVIFRTFTEIEFNQDGEEFGNFPGVDGIQVLFKAFLKQSEGAFEQEHDMKLDGSLVGDTDGGGAYQTTLLAQFLNKENEIIQVFNISWFLERFFDFEAEDSPNAEAVEGLRFTLFAPSTEPVGGPSSFPSVNELLNAFGFFPEEPDVIPLVNADELPDLNEGAQIANSIFFKTIGGEPSPKYDLDAVFFEPMSFVFVFPAFDWLSGGRNVSIVHDIFAMKRDISDAEEKKDLIIAASFEEEVELSYDRTIDFNMAAFMSISHFRTIEGGLPGPPHSEHILRMTRSFFPFSQLSLTDDGQGKPFPLNLNAVSGEGMRYFTDIIPPGGDLFVDQARPRTGGPPQGPFFPARVIQNIKFTGRSKFGDRFSFPIITGDLRPNVPDVVVEPLTVLKVFGTSAGLNDGTDPFFDEGTITNPENSFTVDTFELESFEDFEGLTENEPVFTLLTGGTRFAADSMDPLTNKGAVVFIGEIRKQSDPLDITSDGFFRKILRWDFSDEDKVDFPTQVMRTRESGEGPFDDNQVTNLIAHDGAIFARFAIFDGDQRIVLADGIERFFNPVPGPGDPESLEPLRGFQFILPGRGTPRLISESYTSEAAFGNQSPESIAARAAARDRIWRVTVKNGLAEIRVTTKPPNSDLRRLNPKVTSAFSTSGPSYHYAGVR